MVFASSVVVVTYLVIGKLYLHCLFHQIPCCRQHPVPLSCLHTTLLWKRTRLRGTEVGLLHDPQHAVSVVSFHGLFQVSLPGASIPPGPSTGICLRETVPFQSLPPSSARANSSPDLPMVRCMAIAVPCLLVPQYVAALPKLV